MNEMKVKQIYELVNNENVRFQLENTETIEDIVEVLNQNGIEVSVEEVSAAVSNVGVGGELDENTLENVAGGYCSKGRNWRCFVEYVWNGFKGIFDELSK